MKRGWIGGNSLASSGVRVVLAGIVALAASCNTETGREDQGSNTAALGLPTPSGTSEQVLGFESTSAWSASGGTVASSVARTQGTAAYALSDPSNMIDLTSAAVSSTAPALAGLADPNAAFQLDVQLPGELPSPNNAGSLQLFVDCPSRGLKNAEIGKVDLRGARLGIFRTVKFAIPSAIGQTLAGAAFDDLTFHFKLHTPGRTSASYLFDNLRVTSPSAPPPASSESIDLVAIRSYAPDASTPGVATFSIGVVQVPDNFHLKLGRAGGGTATLELGYAGGPSVTCTYGAGADTVSYVLSSCTGGAQAGDLVGADSAKLTILGGDPSAGPTKIRAQLAKNPAGATAGEGVIPTMPTFWGSTAKEADQIITAYFDAVKNTPPTSEQWINVPVPEFARRMGTGAPHDDLLGPPPANDPPIYASGHMNEGGAWDAYWQLASTLDAPDDHTTRFDTTFGVGATLWGIGANIASVHALVVADHGQVGPSGPSGGGYTYAVSTFRGGIEVAPDEAPGGFAGTRSVTTVFDVATIPIWIFDITLGVYGQASINLGGNPSPQQFAVDVTPAASFGVHVNGGVNLGIASGGVDAMIALLSASTPLHATTTRTVVMQGPSSDLCRVYTTLALTGTCSIGSLGGSVALVARLGICPFCKHASVPIISWAPIEVASFPLANPAPLSTGYPIDPSLCTANLQAGITSPTDGSRAVQDVPVTLSGWVKRPQTAMAPARNIDCARWTWSSSDPADASEAGFPLGGCTASVTFRHLGQRTLTLSATDELGETVAQPPSVTLEVIAAGLHIPCATDCNDGRGCTIDSCDDSTGNCVHLEPDADGDGHGACSDCHEGNPEVYPGQWRYFTQQYARPDGAMSWDYDCSGTAEKRYPGVSTWSSSNSTRYTGWDGEPIPECGNQGTLLMQSGPWWYTYGSYTATQGCH